ncbi:MAG: ECF transporter S component [Lachnospiraceae bacterium]|nr:ECF transporter S component [Lachnospiraceae bacterium]
MPANKTISRLRIKHLRHREMTTIAVMTALAVLSRLCFYMLPEVKPMAAIVIVTAIAFGSMPAFLVGSLTMLISNFIYGQGPWTLWQMLGLGAVGFVAGIIFKGQDMASQKDRLKVSIIGGIITFAIYGFFVDTGSVVFLNSAFNSLAFKDISYVYLSGIVFNAIHGLGTIIFLYLMGNLILKKLLRVRLKYGIFN